MKIDLKRILALIMTVVMVVTTITFTAGNTLKAEGEPASEPAASEPATPAPEPEQKSEPVAEPEAPAADESSAESSDEATNDETATEGGAATEEEAIEEEEEKYPAQSFSKTAGNGIHVSVSAPEGAFPEGTSMSVSAVSREKAMSLVGGDVEDANGVDINFHKDGKEIQPKKNINVSLSNAAVEGESFSVYHVDGGGADRVAGATSNGASFSADSFSIYVIAGEGTGEPEKAGVTTYKFVIDGVVQDQFTQIVKKGDNLYKPEVPTKDGKAFHGWYSSDGSLFTGFGTVENDVDKNTEVTLTGTYDAAAEYTVYFHAGNKICETKTGATGTKIDTSEVLVRTEKGESALGWYEDQAFTKKVGVVTIGTADMHLYAKVSTGHWINYDSDGGTPVDSTFVANGDKSVAPAAPTRAGYTFNYWTLNGSKYTFGQTLTSDIELKASWKGTNANYTVIHWWENADDDDYSFHESEVKTGTSGETTAATAKTYEGFVAQTFTQKTIAGDGSTIVNIKYQRKLYTVYFNDGKYPLICGLKEHKHTSECQLPSCGKDEHEHSDACYSLTCGKDVHQHSDTCYGIACGKADHTHTGACYGSGVSSSGDSSLPAAMGGHEVVETLSDGSKIYKSSTWLSGKLYHLQAPDGKYYEISNYSKGKVKLTCKKHVHSNDCIGLTCGKDVHVHVDGCYKMTCTKEVHKHDDSCYTGSGSKKCKLQEHTHSASCYGKEATGTTITAKYGAYIGDQWPGGSYKVSSSTYQAYLEVMPLNGTTFRGKAGGGSERTATYYAETFKSGEYKVHHKDTTELGGVSVSKEDKYELKGFTYDHGTANGQSYGGAEFYYTRNAYTLNFISNGQVVKSESVKYEADLSNIGYTPTAPSTKSNYKFAGWYDNEFCEGTPYDLNNKKMPDHAITLYAKWEAPKVTVTAYNKLNGGTPTTIVLEYGHIIPKDKLPSSPEGEILGWVTKTGTNNGYKLFNIGSRIYVDTTIYPYVAKDGGPYTITYDKNGATGTAPSDDGKYMIDTKATVAGKGSMVAPEGKHFAGWGTSTYSAGDNIYQPGEKINMTHDYTLYAQWDTNATTDLKLHLDYQYPEGKNKTEDINTANNGKVTLPGAGKTIDGWQFAGWYTQKNGKGTLFTGSVRVDNKLIENNTLYGYWVAQNVGYKVLHKVQKTDGTYELKKTENKTGLTGQMTDAKADASIEAEGYKALSFNNVKIKGNGSTEVVIMYDRNEFSLTVHYKYKNNKETAAKDETRKVVKGSTYNVNSPEIEGFTPDKAVVSGTMGSVNIEETVYYSPSSPLSINVQPAAYEDTYDGKTHGAAVEPSVSSGTTVEYSTDGGTTWSANHPTITDVDEVHVNVRASNGRYGDATAEYDLIVTQRAVTVTGHTLKKEFGESDPKLTAEVSNYVAGELDKIKYSVTREKGEDVGTYVTTPAGKASQGNYTVQYFPGSLEITKSGEFTVSATGYEGVFNNEAHYGTVSPSVTEGTTFEYSTDDGETWSTSQPSITNVGTQTVKVIAHNRNYEDATTTYTDKITPASATVKAIDCSKKFGEADPDPFPTEVTGVLEEGVQLSYTVTREKGSDVDDYTITPAGAATQGNYTVEYKTATFTISASDKLQLDVSGCNYNKPYDGYEHGEAAGLVGTIPGTTTITYSTDGGKTYKEAVPKVKNVADSTKVYVKAENSNYITATAEYTLNVTKAPLTVTADNAGKTYMAEEPELTATVSNLKGEDTESVVGYSVARAPGQKVGEYAITVTETKAPDNYTATYIPGVFTIVKNTDLEVWGTDYEGTYDGKAHGSEAKASDTTEDTVITYSIDEGKTYTDVVPTVTDVADSTTVYVKAENPNYNTAENSYTLTVLPKAVTVDVRDADKVFGEKDPNFEADVSGTIDKDTVDYNITRKKSLISDDEDAGVYENVLVASGEPAQGNYTVEYLPGTFTIKQADGMNLDITGCDMTETYDGKAHGKAATVTPTKAQGTTLKYSTNGGKDWSAEAPTRTEHGTTNVIAKAEHKNYKTVEKEYSITVNPKKVTVSADEKSQMFGEDPKPLTATTEGTIGDDTVDYTLTREAGDTVGDYIISFVDPVAEQGNYAVEFKNNIYTITSNTKLTVNIADGEWTYDNVVHKKIAGSNHDDAVIEYSLDGESWSSQPVSIINPGTVTAYAKASCDGYQDAVKQYTLKVNPLSVTVEADNKKITYGDPEPELTATVKNAIDGVPVDYNIERDPGDAAGDYAIDVSGNATQGGYAVTFIDGTLTIEAKPIGDDKKELKDGFELEGIKDKIYNGTPQMLTPTLTDTQKSYQLKKGTDFDVSYKTEFNPDNFTDVGTITVIITGKNNYSGTVETSYRIKKRTVTLTSADHEWKYDGDKHQDTNVNIGGDGFATANNEGAEFTDFASITDVDEIANTFTYTLKGNTKATNYTITPESGTLSVIADDSEVKVTVKGNKAAYVYDGSEKSVKGYTATSSVSRYNVNKNVNFSGNDEVKGTAAGTYNIGLAADKFSNVNTNYSNVVFDVTDGKLVIVPSSIDPEDKDEPDPDDPDDPYYDPNRNIILANNPSDVPYDGNAHQWIPQLKDKNDKELGNGDYTVTYKRNGEVTTDFTNVGEITVIIQGKGNYGGTLQRTYNITRKVVQVKAKAAWKYYGEKDPAFEAEVKDKAAAGKITYTVPEREGAGTAAKEAVDTYTNAVVPKGEKYQGNFEVQYVPADFEIKKSKIISNDVGTIGPKVYNAEKQEYVPEVTKGGKTLVNGTDFSVSYSEDTKNVGTVTVTITGINGYEGEVTRTYDITAAPVTIDVGSYGKTYGDPEPDISKMYASVGIQGEDDLHITVVRDAGDDVGDYNMTANYDEDNKNYDVKVKDGTFTISKAGSIRLTVENTEVDYDGKDHSLKKVEADKSDAKIYYASEPEGPWNTNQPSYKNIGTHKIYVQAKSDNYEDSPVVEAFVTINQATVVVETESAWKVYDGSELTADGKVTGVAEGEDYTFKTISSITNKGSKTNEYSLTWKNPGDAEHYTIEEKLGTLTVYRSSIDPSKPEKPDPEDKDKPVYNGIKVGTISGDEYDGEEHKKFPEVIDAKGNRLTYGKDFIIDYPSDCTSAGTIDVIVRGINNYGDSVERSYEITPKPVTIEVGTSYTKAYKATDDPPFDKFTVTGTVSEKDKEALNVKCKRKEAAATDEPVGTEIELTATYTKNKNYNVTVIPGKLTIIKSGENYVTVTSYSSKYDGKAHSVQVQAAKSGSSIEYSTTGGDKDSEWQTEPITCTNVNVTSEESKPLTVYVRAKNKNYETTAVKYGTVSIEPATFTVTTYGKTRGYIKGESLTAGGNYTGLQNGEKIESFKTTGSIEDVGKIQNEYVIDWGNTDKKNYNVVEKLGWLEITAKSINNSDITVDEIQPVPYNGQTQHQPVVVKDGGKLLKEGVDYILHYPEDCVNSGTKNVIIEGINNYSETNTEDAHYNITKLDATVTAKDDKKKVGTDDPKSFDTKTEGTIGTESVIIDSVTRAPGEHVGKYAITPAGPESQTNYNVKFVAGTFEITKASIDPKDGSTIISDAPENYVYDGTNDHKWVPVVTDKGGTPLREDDYEVIYQRNGKVTDDFESAGEIEVIIKAKDGGDYSGEVTRTYTIKKADLDITVINATKGYKEVDPPFAGNVVGLVDKDKSDESRIKIEYDRIEADKGKEKVGDDITITAAVSGSAAGNYEKHITDAKLKIQKASGNRVTFDSESGMGTYNGSEQRLVKAKALIEGSKLWYSLDGKEWSEGQPGFKDAGTYKVFVKATHPDYADSDKEEATVVIGPKEITLKTKSAAKGYDGTPLTSKASIEGLVKGESVSFENLKSLTDVGRIQNDCTIKWDKAKESNYKVTNQFGWLTVHMASVDPKDPTDPDPEDPDPNNPVYTNINPDKYGPVKYDGTEKKWTPVLKDKAGNKLVEGVDYTVKYLTEDMTNVGTVQVLITGKGPHYAGSITKTYQIVPRNVVLTSASAKKTYDGTELRADKVTVSGDGFAKDEGFIYEFTESGQTEVGKKANVFTYKLWTDEVEEKAADENIVVAAKATRAENYSIRTVFGTLEVTAAAVTPVPGDNDPGTQLMVNDTVTQIADKETPAALKLFGEDCCILHLLIMLAALLLMIWYVRDSKARQRRILELEEELGINSPLE